MSGQPTLVSVLIPAFNAEKYIGETLASVTNQTYQNLEIIVVDDGSSDGTGRIVQEFSRSDRRIRAFHQPNRGVAAARNHALNAARGEYLAPIDADDLWHPRKIEKQLQKIMTAEQSVVLVYTWMCTISDVGLTRGFHRPADGGVPQLSRMIESNFIGCASVPLMRTGAVREIGGYDEKLRQASAEGCEDYDLYLKLAERWSFTVVPEYLVGYRRRPGQMSANVWSMRRSHEQVIKNFWRRHPEVPFREIRTSCRRMGMWQLVNCIREGRMLTGAALACGVLRSDPVALFRQDTMDYARRIGRKLVPSERSEDALKGRRYPFESQNFSESPS